MRRTPIKKKIGLVLFGLFLCLVLLEIGLRLGGFIILSFREQKNLIARKENGTYRIMCLGGSTTANGGEFSYPSQLEKILNKRKAGIRFKVINKGVGSADSAFILSKFNENLDKYNPDMVITMMGINDGSNTVPFEVMLIVKAKLFISGLRIYKLVNHLWLHIANIVELVNNYDPEKQVMESQIHAIAGSKGISYLIDSYLLYKSQMSFQEAERVFNEAIEVDPSNAQLYIHSGDVYLAQEKFKQIEEMLEGLVKMNPDYDGTSELFIKLGLKRD